MPLVINTLGGRHKHTDVRTKAIEKLWQKCKKINLAKNLSENIKTLVTVVKLQNYLANKVWQLGKIHQICQTFSLPKLLYEIKSYKVNV